MAIESLMPHSRRALLTGSLGGLAALAAQALGRAAPVAAHDPDDVALGGANTATTATRITNTANANTVFKALSSAGGVGVRGESDSSNGVLGVSSTSNGVYGTSAATNNAAIQGQSTGDSTGVLGWSGTGTPPGAPPKTGVFGFADQDATAVGVIGESTSGYGVQGSAKSGFGVYGSNSATDHPAIRGQSFGNTTGVQGLSGIAIALVTPVKTGVYGFADQDTDAVGVRGTSNKGRGGIFTGGRAQLRLVASTAASHPTTGQKGDLFHDRSGRLWFYNGATWLRIV